MRTSFHLIVVILTVIIFAASGVAHAGEKKVFIGGVWYNQQRDGSLTVCQECNAGRPAAAVPVEVVHPPDDCPTAYPCQMIKPQFVTVAASLPAATVEAYAVGSESFGAACASGNCGPFGSYSPRRPIRSLFGRLFAGFSLCGG